MDSGFNRLFLMLDLLIQNGQVFDGLGAPPKRCDVGIRDGRVVVIAPRIREAASEVCDATGLWVAPGFVDIHTHYDVELEIAPGLAESVRHGVTSIVMGNCSLSLAIGEPATLADIFQRVETLPPVLIQKWLAGSMSWRTLAEYVAHLHQLPIGPNVAALFGHSALRAHVMGLERSLKEPATDDELEEMRRLAREALEAGLTGISVDMVPWHMMSGEHRGHTIPSQHADYREYKMLAEVCREFDAVFQVTPNPKMMSSVRDIFKMSLGIIRRPLRVTILAALDAVGDRRLWRIFRPLLFFFNTLLGSNIRFQTLTEAFTIYSDGPITPLFEEFPAGVQLNDCETRAERQALWHDPAFRRRFREEWTSGYRKTFHRQLDLMEIIHCPDVTLSGKSFAQAARERGRDEVEFFMELIETHDTDIRWSGTGANDRLAPRLALMKQKYVLPGFTDAGAHVRNLGYYDGAISLLKQAYTTGFMTPQRAIARVTGEPAAWFRLATGVLQEGARADVVLLNPEHLSEPISPQIEIADPTLDGAIRVVKRESERIVEAVYINGQLVIRRGEVQARLGREKLGDVLHLTDAKAKRNRAQRQDRNRINAQIADHPFTDYWDVFVLKHQNAYNIALHVLGVVIFYGLLAAALATRNAWLLLGLPLSQTVGLLGHYFFEHSHIDWQDAVFSLRASRALNRMFWRILTGQYGEDIRERNDQLRAYQQNHLLSGNQTNRHE